MPLLSAKATVWDKTQGRVGEKAGDGGAGEREFSQSIPHVPGIPPVPSAAGATRTLP